MHYTYLIISVGKDKAAERLWANDQQGLFRSFGENNSSCLAAVQFILIRCQYLNQYDQQKQLPAWTNLQREAQSAAALAPMSPQQPSMAIALIYFLCRTNMYKQVYFLRLGW